MSLPPDPDFAPRLMGILLGNYARLLRERLKYQISPEPLEFQINACGNKLDGALHMLYLFDPEMADRADDLARLVSYGRPDAIDFCADATIDAV